MQVIYALVIRKKVGDFEELFDNDEPELLGSFDVKLLHPRFKKIRTVIRKDYLYDKDKDSLTTEGAM